MGYPYRDAIGFKGHYRHLDDGQDTLFRIYGFNSWEREPIDALHYLIGILEKNPKLSSELSRSPLVVALFFGNQGTDIFYVDPREDDDGNDWLGNGSTLSATYIDGELAGSRESGGRVISCEVGTCEIAPLELRYRRHSKTRESYIERMFENSWPNLATVVDQSIPVIDFNSLLEGSE